MYCCDLRSSHGLLARGGDPPEPPGIGGCAPPTPAGGCAPWVTRRGLRAPVSRWGLRAPNTRVCPSGEVIYILHRVLASSSDVTVLPGGYHGTRAGISGI